MARALNPEVFEVVQELSGNLANLGNLIILDDTGKTVGFVQVVDYSRRLFSRNTAQAESIFTYLQSQGWSEVPA